jgi:hypothetical protein
MTEWCRHHRDLILALLVATALLVAGCRESQADLRIIVQNETDETVTVFSAGPNGPTLIATLLPRQSFTMEPLLNPMGCMREPLFARGSDGQVIVSEDLPICAGSTWTIMPP